MLHALFAYGVWSLAGLLCFQAAPQMDKSGWAGLYSGDGLELDLKPTPLGGWSGVLKFEGKTYTATAKAVGDTLQGTFLTPEGSFAYEARWAGRELNFSTGGTSYRLRKAGTPTGDLFRHGLRGYTIQLAAGWTAQETPEGALLLPAGATFNPNRDDNPEAYIALMREDYDPRQEAQTVQQISAAFTQGGASAGRSGERQAFLSGQRSGAVYRWDLRDPRSGRQLAFDIFLASEGNRAFVFLGVGDPGKVRSHDAEARQMLASFAYTAPKMEAGGALADNSPLAQRWLAKLRGKVIRQFWASQGMSSDKRHWLGADGSYTYKSSSMVSVDVSGASGLSTGGDNSSGRWRIRESGGRVFLEVRYRNGNVEQMPITEDGRNWFLNGEKAFAVDLE